MNKHEDSELWTLLGAASTVKASPMFTQNILRAIRQEPLPWWKRLGNSMKTKTVWSLSTACAVLAISALVLLSPASSNSMAESDLEVFNSQELVTLETTTNLIEADETESALEIVACFPDVLSEKEVEVLLTYID